MNKKTIALISCGALKLEGTHLAKELYIGQYFIAARNYAKSKSWPYFSLSSLYGLLHMEREIQSYDMRMTEFTKSERYEWGRRVMEDLSKILCPGDTVVFLAGKFYVDPLLNRLISEGVNCETPLFGMGIGRQLSYLCNDGKPRSNRSGKGVHNTRRSNEHDD